MTLSTFRVCCQTTENLCPPAPPVWLFITASVFANIQINFQSALRQAGMTSRANTHMENTNTELLTLKHPGLHPTNSITRRVTEIWDASALEAAMSVLRWKIITSGLPSEATLSGALLSRQLLSQGGGCKTCHHRRSQQAREWASCQLRQLSGFLFSHFSKRVSCCYLQIACKVLCSALSPPRRVALQEHN